MKHKLIALILAFTAVSWAQTATPNSTPTPQQSTVPADAKACPCCDKAASAEAKDGPACCAHHTMAATDGKEPACCAGKRKPRAAVARMGSPASAMARTRRPLRAAIVRSVAKIARKAAAVLLSKVKKTRAIAAALDTAPSVQPDTRRKPASKPITPGSPSRSAGAFFVQEARVAVCSPYAIVVRTGSAQKVPSLKFSASMPNAWSKRAR